VGFEEKGYDFLPTMQQKNKTCAVKRTAIIGVVWIRFCLGGYIIILQLVISGLQHGRAPEMGIEFFHIFDQQHWSLNGHSSNRH